MKILIDECVPRPIIKFLVGHIAKTAQEVGWGVYNNGQLLRLAENEYDLFITADQNIRYQQNLKGRKLAIIEFPSNKLSVVKRLEAELKTRLQQINIGDYVTLAWP